LNNKLLFGLIVLLQIIPGMLFAQDYLIINNSVYSRQQACLYSDSCNAHTALKSSLNFKVNTDIVSFDNPIVLEKEANSWFKRKLFYEHLGVVKNKDYTLILSPLLDLEYSRDLKNNENNYRNTRGVVIYGNLSDRITFNSEFYETQASFPEYINNYYQRYGVLPGQPRVKPYGNNAYDWGSAFGSVSLKAAPFLYFQLGNDKNFIGDGYRSFMLSDYATQYMYFKTLAKFGRFYYQKMFLNTINPSINSIQNIDPNWTANSYVRKKNISITYLGANITNWLQAGLFEAIVFDSSYEWDFNILNPIPIVRSFQFAADEDYNSFMGLNICTKLPFNTNIYGQLVFNKEWELATQAGIKFYKTAKDHNIFAQIEFNQSNHGYESLVNIRQHYGHYSQSLAHPGGNGFTEVLVNTNYQYKRWHISVRANRIWYKGLDEGAYTYLGEFVSPLFAFSGNVLTARLEPAYIINNSYNLMIYSSIDYYRNQKDYLIFGFGLKTALRNKYHDF